MTPEKKILHTKLLLRKWLIRQVPTQQFAQLDLILTQVTNNASECLLSKAFSAVPRYTSRADIALTDDDLKSIRLARLGWTPSNWSLDQVGRSLLLLSLPTDNAQKYYLLLEEIFNTADVNEQISLYQSLPIIPHPKLFVGIAIEGLSTSITPVFNAIALCNPFPGDYFELSVWNQMILKAVSVGSSLRLIQRIDQRANAELACMLLDYVHERWAAKRRVSPELWQLMLLLNWLIRLTRVSKYR
jgi:hypothetical protein